MIVHHQSLLFGSPKYLFLRLWNVGGGLAFRSYLERWIDVLERAYWGVVMVPDVDLMVLED